MIRDAILMQKRELGERMRERYIEREAKLKGAETGLIKVIIGPRRVGKSFFAVHILSSMGQFGYANFDDEKLASAADYDEIISAIDSVYGSPERILLDEIQNLPKWELFVNRLARQGRNLFVTGSNAHLLSRELATHLTGRHTKTDLLPFSFMEYLGGKKAAESLTGAELRQKFEEYAERGGYPEPLAKGLAYPDYLSTLFDSVVYKDIVKHYRIRNAKGIEDVAHFLVSNIAQEFSYNRLKEVARCGSVHTAQKYISYLEEAYLFFSLRRFSFKAKEQSSSNKKAYCIDNGFMLAKAFSASPERGKRLENLVAVHLKRKELEGSFTAYYWKSAQGGEEVDFVIWKGNKVEQLIQVCAEPARGKTRDRETRALLKASKELGCKSLVVLTSDYESEEKLEWFGVEGKARFVPLHKWLLQE